MGWRFAQLDEDEAPGLEGEDAFDEPQPRRLFGMVDVGDDDVAVTRFGQPDGDGMAGQAGAVIGNETVAGHGFTGLGYESHGRGRVFACGSPIPVRPMFGGREDGFGA